MNPPLYQPGQVLPGTVYRVVRHLATGGMGSVYDVEDTTVEKRYVLKTLHPQLVSREDLARRMRDEAKSLAKLQHPNIVDVITAGVTSDAVKMPFYVMERLIGQNLRVVLEKKSALDLTHAYRIAIDVADALEHAHENNLVHRDVKPENIFLHRNANGTTTTKLLDFGIVRLLDRKASHTHGKFIGTLRYASPEQITGRPIGPQTDIYSLGLVLYEMLCGRGPFDDVGDQYAIGAAHASQDPPLLSQFVRVTAEVERLITTMLAKDPAARPRDCFAIASDLRRILRDEEASPKSATAVNVLSAAAPDHSARAPAGSVDTGPTVQQLAPPSAAAAAAAMMTRQPDTPLMAGAPGAGEPRPLPAAGTPAAQISSPPVSPIAPTLAVAGVPEQLVGPPIQVHAPGYESAPHGTPARPAIDRNAPTRASAPFGGTQRISPNDTKIDLSGSGTPPMPRVEGKSAPVALANDDVVRDAFGQPAPLVVPPMQGNGSSPGDIVFPPMRPSTSTGPISSDARSRTVERGPMILVAAAAAIATVLIVVAFIVVRITRGGASSPTSSLAVPPTPPEIAPAVTAPPSTPTTVTSPPSAPAAAASSNTPAAAKTEVPTPPSPRLGPSAHEAGGQRASTPTPTPTPQKKVPHTAPSRSPSEMPFQP